MGPSNNIRSRKEGSKTLSDLEKWNTSVFLCSKISPNCSRREEIII